MTTSRGFVKTAVSKGFSATNLSDMRNWPDNVLFYQPHESDQSLLYEFSECLAVRALLHMSKLPFTVENRGNTEHMSPSGDVPFLRLEKSQGNDVVVAGFDPIVSLLAIMGIKPSDILSDEDVVDMKADMSYVGKTFSLVEQYVCWCHEETMRTVSMRRCGSIYTWPLNFLVPTLKKWRMLKRLKSFNWAHKSITEVLQKLDGCCQILSQRLGKKAFFYTDDTPTELDALVFGHLFSILTTELPDIDLAAVVRKRQNLVDFCQRIEKDFFSRRSK